MIWNWKLRTKQRIREDGKSLGFFSSVITFAFLSPVLDSAGRLSSGSGLKPKQCKLFSLKKFTSSTQKHSPSWKAKFSLHCDGPINYDRWWAFRHILFLLALYMKRGSSVRKWPEETCEVGFYTRWNDAYLCGQVPYGNKRCCSIAFLTNMTLAPAFDDTQIWKHDTRENHLDQSKPNNGAESEGVGTSIENFPGRQSNRTPGSANLPAELCRFSETSKYCWVDNFRVRFLD